MPDSTAAYAVAATAAAEILRALGSRFPVRRDRRSSRRETFLDTIDWRIHAGGGLLGAAPVEGETQLTLRGGDGEPRLRLRVPQVPAFVQELPSSPLRESLETAVGVRRLLPVVTVDLEVDTLHVLDERGKVVAHVRVERGAAFAPEAPETRRRLARLLRVVSVKGYGEQLVPIVAFLEDERGLRPHDSRELPRALRAIGRRVEVPEPFRPELEPAGPGAREVRKILRPLLAAMVRNEEGVRRDLDSEFLHDFRVSVRRARAALGQIRGVFPEERVERFRAELSWLQQVTGPVRDLDVYLLHVPGYRESLPPELRAHLAPLEAFLRRHKLTEQAELVAVLDGERYRAVRREWGALLEDLPSCAGPPPPNAERPVGEIARARIAASFAKVLERGTEIGPDSPPAELHRLRIGCKKLRYLLEFFAGLFSDAGIGRPVAALKGLQDCLGDFNDLIVQEERLREFARRVAEEGLEDPGLAAAIDRLVGNLQDLGRRQRGRFHKRFSRFASERNRERFQKLVSDGPEARA